MTWVVDASVAVKWFVDEVRSAEARAYSPRASRSSRPNLIIPESCNTAWKKVRRGDISLEQGEAMVRALPLAFDRSRQPLRCQGAPWNSPGGLTIRPTIASTWPLPRRSRDTGH